MKKYVCIHGHFYQPPRENPWTGEVDAEESAKPFHDWNERIAKECYGANAGAPIMNAKGEIAARVNNFEKLSFDIGPTLLSWMRRKDPVTYKAIVEADKKSAMTCGGHGNAIAQVYNHVIMPLASRRDKITQVIWGVRDFEFHYGHKPEGMWLSETAVDKETLAILADQGILYTILAPHQARRARHIGFGSRWHALGHELVDPKRAYRILLDQGRQFHIFFYDAPISRSIAFQGLLNSGDALSQRLLSAFGHRDREQIVSTATDGESFGHHHRFGEMAIAYAMQRLEEQKLATITNYGEFLDLYGSYWEVDIYEQSSWSCAHGIERWRSDCGCRINHEEGWNQKWRTVLRDAFDFLKETVDQVFETQTAPLLKNPWDARNGYIDILLEDTPEIRKRFLSGHARRALSAEEEKRIFDLLEAEKFSMFMYTSCAWFFDDISGIEPVHMMKFALRAMDLVQPYHPKGLEAPFTRILAAAKSNIKEMGTGEDVFVKFVKPVRDGN
jgi:alpha-amylase/alpha-mannosidase (GH57 family)